MNTVIATTNLTKHYGAQRVVDQVSLHVGPGEIYAFLGLNGAGKTTTIRMLLGMIRPTAGTACILGMPVQPDAHELWSQVGYLVETPSAYPELTARENLEIARRLHGMHDTQIVNRTLDQLALAPYANHRARTLSLGNAQRLGLAKALLHHPQVLILDEPANGLDPAGVVEVRELLHELALQQGVTIFMSSHLLSEVARIATRFGIIHQGRLLEEVDTAEMERKRHRRLEIDARDRRAAHETLLAEGFSVEEIPDGPLILTGDEALTHPEDIARCLVGAGIALTRLSVKEEDLETQFLRLVGVTQEKRRDAIRR
jgi:ABC-2 type transport system ATP-binding protein